MMNEMIKKQNFGVEIEMNNMNRSKAQKIVAKVLGSTNPLKKAAGMNVREQAAA